MVVRLLHYYEKPVEPKYEFAMVYRRNNEDYYRERDVFRFYSKDKVPEKHLKFMSENKPTMDMNGVKVWDFEKIEEMKGVVSLV